MTKILHLSKITQKSLDDYPKAGFQLRSYRELKKLSVEDVSKILSIPISKILEIENGQLKNNLQSILIMLGFYGKSVHEVFGGFLLKKTFSENQISQFQNVTSYVLESISFQKILRNKSVSVKTQPLNRSSRASNKSSVKHSRSATRSALSPSVVAFRAERLLIEQNIHQLPINVYQIAKNLNIHVGFDSFPSDFYMKIKGYAYRDDEIQIIGVNRSHPIPLQRFTVAHELHHILYDLSESQFLCQSDNMEEQVEKNAEAFAAELLMPTKFIQGLLSNPLNIKYLTVHLVARHFGVSYEAAAIRLQKFQVLNSANLACQASYRKQDQIKTKFLLKEKLKYLIAVFGLETGIAELLHEPSHRLMVHNACGFPIIDPKSNVCWHCGLEISHEESPSIPGNYFLQSPSNLSPEKVVSFDRRQHGDYKQLSLNLSILDSGSSDK